MDQQNTNKINRLSFMKNTDLRSNLLRSKKLRQSLYSQPAVTDGVMNRFGFIHRVNRRMDEENQQPLKEKSKIKLPKKNNVPKRPTFKVGIPHHKYWSPTARDTPRSHFHGLNKGYKFLKKMNQDTVIGKIDQERPFASTDMTDLIQKETIQEVIEKKNAIDKSEKDIDVMEMSNTSDLDLLNSDGSKSQINIFNIVITIIIYYIIINYIILLYKIFFE